MPTWEERRSTVAEVAGHPRYWRAITQITRRLGNFFAFFSHQASASHLLSLLLFPEPTLTFVQVLFEDYTIFSVIVIVILVQVQRSSVVNVTVNTKNIVQPLTFGYPI